MPKSDGVPGAALLLLLLTGLSALCIAVASALFMVGIDGPPDDVIVEFGAHPQAGTTETDCCDPRSRARHRRGRLRSPTLARTYRAAAQSLSVEQKLESRPSSRRDLNGLFSPSDFVQPLMGEGRRRSRASEHTDTEAPHPRQTNTTISFCATARRITPAGHTGQTTFETRPGDSAFTRRSATRNPHPMP